VSRRGDRPDAIAWLLRYHPELPDAAVMKLVGTTKHTINSVRERSHWNIQSIKPVDPVSLGLCSQLDLDFAVQKAANRGRKVTGDAAAVRTLIPAAEVEGTEAYKAAQAKAAEEAAASEEASPPGRSTAEIDVDSVFAKLKGLKTEQPDE
jgi:hypothetical protein